MLHFAHNGSWYIYTLVTVAMHGDLSYLICALQALRVTKFNHIPIPIPRCTCLYNMLTCRLLTVSLAMITMCTPYIQVTTGLIRTLEVRLMLYKSTAGSRAVPVLIAKHRPAPPSSGSGWVPPTCPSLSWDMR